MGENNSEDRVNVTHIIAEFRGCDEKLLDKSDVVKEILEDAVKKSELTKIRSHFHQFSPFGVTGFILLKESHISVHTWPEFNYAAIDVFGCGDRKKVLHAYNLLAEHFKPSEIKKKEIKRGLD
ncbi:MAG: adenosylmethionine decarboxylase [Candidatus Aenigmarchaeota archaeon]|nr:adenosylmethionine decarboxylase [Candidatus Aenigmarchaeota archaeon]